MRVRKGRSVRRGKEVGGSVGMSCRSKAGRVRGRGVEGMQVGMEIGCHMVGGDSSRGRVLCV